MPWRTSARRALAGAFFAGIILAGGAFSADESVSPEAAAERSASDGIDFASEIFPIFQQRCLSCHGPEQQLGGLRLDSRTVALRGGAAGPNILPGEAEASPLLQRIAGVGSLNPMPMTGERLSPEQVGLVRAWIDQGATWPDGVGVEEASVSGHWAYLPPSARTPPLVGQREALRNPIDSFVLARLESEGLSFAPEASKETLVRRLSLDLRGLPPTLGEVDEYLADDRSGAYGRLVDRMLKSPHFGEHWAGYWLDLARYADTNGYESDEPRTMWAYRDWVVDAFNRNLPFDQFTAEQLAGDLLPNPTVDQLVATGFHRNTMLTNEAGSKNDEFYDAAVKDRVDTTATVWLGSTLGCAQCHDHKYDPFRQSEYYRMYALFNNTADSAIKMSEELEVFKGDVGELRRREEALAEQRRILDTATPELAVAQSSWEAKVRPEVGAWRDAWQVLRPGEAKAEGDASLDALGDDSVLARAAGVGRQTYELTLRPNLARLTGLRLEALTDPSLPGGGPGAGDEGAFFLSGVEAEVWSPTQLERHAALSAAAPKWGPWHAIGPFRVRSRGEAFDTAFPPESNYDLSATYEEGHLAWNVKDGWRDGRVHYLGYIPDDNEANCASYVYRTIEAIEPTTVGVSLGTLKGLKVWLNSRLVLSTDPTRAIAPDQDELRLNLRAGANHLLLKLTNDRGPYGFYFQPYFGLEREARVRFKAASADHGGWEAVDLTSVLDGRADTGWAAEADGRSPTGTRHAVLQLVRARRVEPGSLLKVRLIHDAGGGLGRFRLAATGLAGSQLAELRRLPTAVRQVLAKEAGQRSEHERRQLAAHYRSIAPGLEAARRRREALVADLAEFRARHTTKSPVMRELPEPRETRIQNRGDFLDLAEKVEPGVPAAVDASPGAQVGDRLALARWLVSDRNPLAARVRVNQIWNRIFGRGLVATAEDFGTQGAAPSHPGLLDWLALEFQRAGWDAQALLRTIVTSAVYRQASAAPAAALVKDPSNILLSRGARYRVAAESVRDIALAVSGLLSRRIGGPSVFPPQPDAVFADLFIEGGFKYWPTSEGADRYRRGLYTFYKRTVVYPPFMTFDAPDRTVCTVDRSLSNTPLQALNTLNDPAFFEAAGALAHRMLDEAPTGEAARLAHGFRLALARRPNPGELQRLAAFVEQAATRYRDAPSQAESVVARAFGDRRTPFGADELAPWVMAANVLLNLDETFTRE